MLAKAGVLKFLDQHISKLLTGKTIFHIINQCRGSGGVGLGATDWVSENEHDIAAAMHNPVGLQRLVCILMKLVSSGNFYFRLVYLIVGWDFFVIVGYVFY